MSYHRAWNRACAPLTAAALNLALASCDSQVSPQYRGESLLTVSGSVMNISDNQPQGPLVPALAFTNSKRNEVRLVEVAVKGEFPSDFRMDVYDPPPSEALVPVNEGMPDTRAAFGYITAVSKRHAAVIRFADEGTGASMGCPENGCGDEPITSVNSWCTSSEPVACYIEHDTCPGGDQSSPACVRVTEGDPTLKEPWREFGGFSQNYVVLYLERAAKAGSWVAAVVGAPDGLEKGYHLFELQPQGDAANNARQACEGDAQEAAAAQYNQQHASQITIDEASGGCAVQLCAPADNNCGSQEIGLCALPEAEQQRIRAELALALADAELDLGCLDLARSVQLVKDPAHTSISVVIGASEPPSLGSAPSMVMAMDGASQPPSASPTPAAP
jgi:hypothetical protein